MKHDLKNILEQQYGCAETICKRIQEELTDGMWMQDLQQPGREWMSTGFLTTLGYNADELADRDDVRSRIALAEDVAIADEDICAYQRDSTRPYDHIVRYRTAAGGIVWMRRRGVVLHQGPDAPRYLLGTFTDVTDLMQARSAIRTRDDHMATMLSNTSAAIWAKDIDGRYLFANRSFTDLCNSTPEAIHHMTDTDLFPEAIARQRHEQDQCVMRTGEAVEVMETYPTMAHDRTFMTTKFPLRKASDEIYAVASIGTDITDLVTARKQLEAVNAEIDAKNYELEQFVYTVSHDLKSPIVTILGYLSHLVQDFEAQRMDEIPDYAARIRKAAERMRTNIDDLLELSRVGRVTPIPESVDLDSLVTHVSESLTVLLLERDITIRTRFEVPTLTLDHTHAKQVLQNLMENAIRYGCTADQRSVEVGTMRHGDSQVRLYVRDHGPGIEEHLHERVFGLFERLSNDHSGTGIGLAIVRRVVEVNHGRIWIEHTPGGGATFLVELPLDSEHTSSSAPARDHDYASH
jgi:PAS domain S-box-containing protein